jgi:hypothetical protein
MYIRRTRKTDKNTGKSYFYYQLIEAYRTPRGPRQKILLNLGKLDLDERERKCLADRIEQLISGQRSLIDPPEKVEKLARKFASKLRKEIVQEKENETCEKEKKEPHWETVDINSVETSEVRTIGGELIGLWAYDKLGLSDILSELGFSKEEILRAKVLILGKLLNPGSELDIHNWFHRISALDELMGLKGRKISLLSLYRISDKLESHKEEIEQALVERARKLFGLGEKLILYDLTNMYFEGSLRNLTWQSGGIPRKSVMTDPLLPLLLFWMKMAFLKQVAFSPEMSVNHLLYRRFWMTYFLIHPASLNSVSKCPQWS